MQALWPRGFVDESNLTKHIWLIRKALGGEHESHCIETVPKLGYRFVAPVQRIERGADTLASGSSVASLSKTEMLAVNDADTPPEETSAHPTVEPFADRDAQPRAVDGLAPPSPTPAPRRRVAWIASIAAAIVCPVVGGLQTTPDNIKSAAFVFSAVALVSSGHITLPAISPLIVTDPEVDDHDRR